jgi:hypothetical protein
MAFNTKLNLTDAKFYQADGGILTLSGDTKIPSIGTIAYVAQPVLTALQLANTSYVTGCTAGAAGAACTYAHAQDAIVSGATLSAANSYTDTCAGTTLSSANSYTDTCAGTTLSSANSYTDTCVGNCTITACNGLNKSGTVINLGGILTGDTCLGHSDNQSLHYFMVGAGTCALNQIHSSKLYIGSSCVPSEHSCNMVVTNTKSCCGCSSVIVCADTGIQSMYCDCNGCNRTTLLGTNAMVYSADYSACYTDRSLVDKGYLATVSGATASYATNGLNKNSGNCIGLGGALTGTTTIYGSQILNINVNDIYLSGVSSGIHLSGITYLAPPVGTGNLLCINIGTGEIGVTSLSAFGGITGGTNGIYDIGNYQLGLGGALCEDTTICGAGKDFKLGTAGSKLDEFDICGSGATQMLASCMSMTASGLTFTDLSASPTGIQYGGDYSTTFVDASLVSKCYVDTIATGLIPHAAVRVATTVNIVLNSGTTSLDGITLVNGNRVLVKDQNTGSQNGIYIVNSGGTWTRASDFDFTPSGEISSGDLIPVLTGSTQASTVWILTTPNPISSGDTLTFTLFTQLLGVIAGNGINITPSGNKQSISINLGGSEPTSCGLTVSSNGLCIDSGIAGHGLSYSAGVLNADVCSGGTGSIPVRYNVGDTLLVVNAGDISNALGGVLTGATNGLTDSNGVVCLGGTLCVATTICGDDTNSLTFRDTAITDKKGILYYADYSPTFVANSLVSAQYVTGLTSCLSGRVDDLETWSGVTNGRLDDLETFSGNSQPIIDVALTGATNGLTVDAYRKVGLGGALTGDTCIDVNGHIFTMNGAPGDCFIEFNDTTPSATISTLNSNNGCTNICATGTGGIKICAGGIFDIGFCGTGIITDSTPSTPAGLQYASDAYRANFTDCSLVDKKYVCSQTSGITTCAITNACNGLTKNGQTVNLGGALTGDTTISGAYDFGVNVTNVYLTGSSTVKLNGASEILLSGSTIKIGEPIAGTTSDDVLVWDSADSTIKKIPSDSLGEKNNIYSKTIVTGNTTLTTGSSYVILVSGATIITLPSAPLDGQAFKIKDASFAGALINNITIARNNKNIDGAGTNATINTDGGALELMYDVTRGWSVLSFVN